MSSAKKHYIIAREGFPFVIAPLALTPLAFLAGFPVIGYTCLALGLFCAFFFRDPERAVPSTPNALVSPADGRVVEVKKVDEPNFIKGPATQVSVFLSVFNVHINRIPIAGEITFVKYNHGKFLPAFREKSSLLNEQNMIGVEGDAGKVLINQIAGLIARRIVCWVKPGDPIARGERVGLIRFGSRVDIFLPPTYQVHVKKGDVIKGGLTIIGETR